MVAGVGDGEGRAVGVERLGQVPRRERRAGVFVPDDALTEDSLTSAAAPFAAGSDENPSTRCAYVSGRKRRVPSKAALPAVKAVAREGVGAVGAAFEVKSRLAEDEIRGLERREPRRGRAARAPGAAGACRRARAAGVLAPA